MPVCSIFQIDLYLLCRGANPNGLDILALRQLSKQAISDHFQASGELTALIFKNIRIFENYVLLTR